MAHTDFTQDNKDAPITTTLWLIVLVIIPFLFGLVSLSLGKDINWDLLNYHYYNAYAFLEHRLDYDIAPAQLQTFINPIADIPFYLMVRHFPAWVAGFVLGFTHGFNLSLIFLIFWKVTNHSDKWRKFLYGICLVIISGIAPGFISELGNTMHDNLTSLFVLFTVLALVTASEKLSNNQYKLGLLYIGTAGLAMGLGVGIKPSITIFAISSAFVLAVFQSSWRNKLTSLFIYGITGITGGLITAGFWWWEMWKRFQNPFFPFYNHIFKSPYFTSTHINWSFYLPDRLWEYFLWPLIFSLDSYRVNQLRFFDIRFALLYLLFWVWLTVIILRKLRLIPQASVKQKAIFNTNLCNYLLFFFILSYIFWIRESATYRFLIPLELLVPLCFFILLERLLPSQKMQIILAVSAAVLTISLFRSFNWGRLDWGTSYFSIDTSHFDPAENTIVVMLGRSPTSYLIPEFPKNYRFVRPEGNLYAGKKKQQIFFIMIKDMLEKQKGSFYILYNKEEPDIQPEESLLRLGITPSIEECFLLKVNTPDILEMCRVSR